MVTEAEGPGCTRSVPRQEAWPGSREDYRHESGIRRPLISLSLVRYLADPSATVVPLRLGRAGQVRELRLGLERERATVLVLLLDDTLLRVFVFQTP